MYRRIDTAIWTMPAMRQLEPPAKLLYLYLRTNPHGHLSGIYYLPLTLAMHETGLSEAELGYGIDTLSIGHWARYDAENEVVWVVDMLEWPSMSCTDRRSAPRSSRWVAKE